MNSLFRISLSLVFLFTVGCVEDTPDDGPLESQQDFVERLETPIFQLLDDNGGISTEFGYTSEEGWEWIDHRADDFSPKPLGVAYFIDAKALGFKAKAPEGQSFPTSTFGGTAYSASTIPRSFGASTSGSTDFGLVPFSDVFSSDLVGGQCSLTKLCDVALAICETKSNIDCAGIDRCYAEIYQIELPPEFQSAYFCWILDFIECVFRNGESACGVQ